MHSPQRTEKSTSEPRQDTGTNRTSVMYIVIVSAVVFSMILAGLTTVNWGGLFDNKAEPTPDFNSGSIATQQAIAANDPDNPEEQALLASMLANSGRMQEAIPVYEKALDLAPDNATIRLDFARSLQTNGMPQDAEAQFLKVLADDPENHTAHYYLARLYLDMKPERRDEAVTHLQRVIEIAPDSFLAQQAQEVLATLGPSSPVVYIETPVSSPIVGG